MKEKTGVIMTEFVELKAKMYALHVQEKKDIKKAKGVKSNVRRNVIIHFVSCGCDNLYAIVNRD